jgi:hypothetical protein
VEERNATAVSGHIAPSRTRLLPWALANLGLFLIVTLVGAVVIGVLDAGGLGVGQGVFAAGFLIPITASPVLLIVAYGTQGLILSPMHAVALAYGLVARLRQPRPTQR